MLVGAQLFFLPDFLNVLFSNYVCITPNDGMIIEVAWVGKEAVVDIPSLPWRNFLFATIGSLSGEGFRFSGR
jgi:hypothetical protein